MFTARAPPVQAAGSGKEDRHGTELHSIHSGFRRQALRRLLGVLVKGFYSGVLTRFYIESVSGFAVLNLYEVFRPTRARRAVFCARLREENKQPDRKKDPRRSNSKRSVCPTST
ncbi:hypothetical protein PGIGA_G00140370 [Pangasianodon gigas]|uniref:Uncharacterized protein n=1 Tax=Pangasianodon gigas TaxID=30993 RepID=A0ACC5XKW0_PANGG|nr:hypothetical protein [Pangasianodon gigas]